MAKQTKTKLPEFKGKPLSEIPKSTPQADFLRGDFGKAVLKEYKGRAKSDYGSAQALNVLSYEDQLVKGSNPFATVLVNQIIRPEGLRVATQADLERILRIGAFSLKGAREHTGLVLRDEREPNSYLAKDLMAQIKKRSNEAKMPVMVSLSELELVTDSNSPYGLRFNLREDSEIFYGLSILNEVTQQRFNSEDIDEKTGLPKKVGGKGSRILLTRDWKNYPTKNSGLSGICFGGGGSVYSSDGYLSGSKDNDFVVVVSAGGALPKI